MLSVIPFCSRSFVVCVCVCVPNFLHPSKSKFDSNVNVPFPCLAATPSNLMVLRNDLAEVALQIDAEEDLFVRKGVAIKYLRKALKKKEQDMSRLRTVVDARDVEIHNLRDRMDSVHRLISGISSFSS